MGQPEITLEVNILFYCELLAHQVYIIGQVIVKRLETLKLLDRLAQIHQVLLVLCHCVDRLNCVFLGDITFELLFDRAAATVSILFDLKVLWLVLLQNVFVFEDVLQVALEFVLHCVFKDRVDGLPVVVDQQKLACVRALPSFVDHSEVAPD